MRRSSRVVAVGSVVILAVLGTLFPQVSSAAGIPSISKILISQRAEDGSHRLLVTGKNLGGVTKLRYGSAPNFRYSKVVAANHPAEAPNSKLTPLAPPGVDLRKVAVVSAAGTSNVSGVPPKIERVEVLGETEEGGVRLVVDGTNLKYASAMRYGPATGFFLSTLTAAEREPAGSDVQIHPVAPPGADLSRIAVANKAGASNMLEAYVPPPPPPPPPTLTNFVWTSRRSDNSYGLRLTGTGFLKATHVVFGDGAQRVSYELKDSDRDPAGSDTEVRATAAPGVPLTHIRVVGPDGESEARPVGNTVFPIPVLSHAEFLNYTPGNGSVIRLHGQNLLATGWETSVVFGANGSERVTVNVPVSDVANSMVVVTAPFGVDVGNMLVSTRGGHSNIIALPNTPVIRRVQWVENTASGYTEMYAHQLAGTPSFSNVFKALFGWTQVTGTDDVTSSDYYPQSTFGIPDRVKVKARYTGNPERVTLLSPNGPSNGVVMGDVPAPPSITNVEPFTSSSGKPMVRILGTSFQDLIYVTVDELHTVWTVVNGNVEAELPSGASGTAEVRVQSRAGLSNAFQIEYPEVTSVTGGTTINGKPALNIYGSGFNSVQEVFFAFTKSLDIETVSPTHVRASIPDLPPGQSALDIPIVVRTVVGTSKNYAQGCPGSPNCYSYPPPVPVVTAVHPYNDSSGVPHVRIVGSNFRNVTNVKIGGKYAEWWPVSDTALLAQLPWGSGVASVQVTNGSGTSAPSSSASLTYPAVTKIEETEQFEGNRRKLRITGSGFMNSWATRAERVYFGERSTGLLEVISDTEILALIPQLDFGQKDLRVSVTVQTPFGTSSPQCAACTYSHRNRYVALGDSFSSGEGAGTNYSAFEYWEDGKWIDTWKLGTGVEGRDKVKDPVTGAETWNNNCHQSKYAYAKLVEQQLSKRSYDLDFQACSGAVMRDVESRRQYPGLSLPNQLEAIDSKTALVTLGIGGNDMGFAPLLGYCVFESDCQEVFNKGLYAGQYEDIFENNIRAMYPRLVRLYTKVRNRADNAPVYVLGYPTIFSESISGGTGCPGTQAFGCTDGFETEEKKWITSRQDQFTEVQRLAAKRAGVHFVDLTDAYANHEFSAPQYGAEVSDAWINPFHLGPQLPSVGDGDGKGKFPFHPTIEGHAKDYELLEDMDILFLKQNPDPDPTVEGPTPTDHWWTVDRVAIDKIGTCAMGFGTCLPFAQANHMDHPLMSVGLAANKEPLSVPWGTKVKKVEATSCLDGLWHGPKANMDGEFAGGYVHCGPHFTHGH